MTQPSLPSSTWSSRPLRHELVFGIVGPIGVRLPEVRSALALELERVGYEAITISLSGALGQLRGDIPDDLRDEFLQSVKSWITLPQDPKDVRYNVLMSAGNCVRRAFCRGDALALLAVNEIRSRRLTRRKPYGEPDSVAYVLSQLKHPSEVETLRAIYGPAFFLVGVHATPSERRKNLAETIASSYSRSGQIDEYRAQAAAIISRDENEHSDLGQKLRDTFHRADIFVNSCSNDGVRTAIRRFVELLFGNSLHTPSRDEYGMALAHAAALRSGALSRQVGAAISGDHDGEVFSLGLNDVPRPGGGMYWAGDADESREHSLGEDPSERMRDEVLEDILRRLKNGGFLASEKATMDGEAIVRNLMRDCLTSNNGAVMKGAEYRTLIEHGRTVHAEMAAILHAARSGVGLDGGTLYTSTFPCHLCARHIVASGIQRVVFMEPYPKSKVVALHSDAIEVDGEYSGASKTPVLFETFVGIAPRLYSTLFSIGDSWPRKATDGTYNEWRPSAESIPRLPRSHTTFSVVTINEELACKEFVTSEAGQTFGLSGKEE